MSKIVNGFFSQHKICLQSKYHCTGNRILLQCWINCVTTEKITDLTNRLHENVTMLSYSIVTLADNHFIKGRTLHRYLFLSQLGNGSIDLQRQ